jgi:DNA-binding MarR family transcriptional regulator
MSMVDGANRNEERFGGPVQALLAEVNALATELRKPLAVAGREAVVPAGERSILQALAEQGPRTVPGIARARGSSRQSVQMLVNRLKGQGWVELLSNPAHKRSALVCLTAQGRALVEEVGACQAATLEARLEGISAAGVSRACALLRRVRAALTGKARAPGNAAVTSAGERRLPPEPGAGQAAEPVRRGRRRGALAPAEATAPAEASQPNLEELPVSLL